MGKREKEHETEKKISVESSFKSLTVVSGARKSLSRKSTYNEYSVSYHNVYKQQSCTKNCEK